MRGLTVCIPGLLGLLAAPASAAEGVDCISDALDTKQMAEVGAVLANEDREPPQILAETAVACGKKHGWNQATGELAVTYTLFKGLKVLAGGALQQGGVDKATIDGLARSLPDSLFEKFAGEGEFDDAAAEQIVALMDKAGIEPNEEKVTQVSLLFTGFARSIALKAQFEAL